MSSPTETLAGRPRRSGSGPGAMARLVPVLSWIAAATGIGFFGLFLYQAGLFSALGPEPKKVEIAIERPEQIASHDSTVTGFDRDKQPYEIRARSGFQDRDKPNLVHLEVVDGTFSKAAGGIYRVISDRALYDSKAKTLELDGNVRISDRDQFAMRMAKAVVGVEDKRLSSGVPVVVDMPNGHIAANGVEISDDGNRILFVNGVKARFPAGREEGDGGQ